MEEDPRAGVEHHAGTWALAGARSCLILMLCPLMLPPPFSYEAFCQSKGKGSNIYRTALYKAKFAGHIPLSLVYCFML